MSDWLIEEEKTISANVQLEDVESLKLEEGKVYEIKIDFSKPFDKWTDPESGAIKKIIKVEHEGKKKNFWLNVKNPLYAQIIKAKLQSNQEKFKIIRTGKAKGTRYQIVT